MLSGFGELFGMAASEKISVALCVLIFFWGLFALVCATTWRAPWLLVPGLALASYGWTFHMGFFNYYLAIGLAFFGVAIGWRGRGWERWLALAISPLIAMAHPFGIFFMFPALAYVLLAERIPSKFQLLLLASGVGIIALARVFLEHRYIIEPPSKPFFFFTGADQFVIFGDRYKIIEYAIIALVNGALLVDWWMDRGKPATQKHQAIPSQLYVLVCAGVFFLPRGVRFPGHPAAISLITERLTTLACATTVCLLGAMTPRKWHFAASFAVAALFFTFLYQDTAVVNNIEGQAEQLVRTLPRDHRVLATIEGLSGYRVSIEHVIDEACIGYCFNYGNYEPGSQVFRVRAEDDNPYVLSSYDDATDTEEGNYVIQPQDLPVSQVFQCDDTGKKLCIRALAAGEENDRTGLSRRDN